MPAAVSCWRVRYTVVRPTFRPSAVRAEWMSWALVKLVSSASAPTTAVRCFVVR